MKLGDQNHLASLPPGQAIAQGELLLQRIVRDHALHERLPQPESMAGPTFWTLNTDSALTVQLFVWPGGVWTPIHDHTSWGVYRCVAGTLVEDRYARLDDGSQSGSAQLRRAWRSVWRAGDQSSLLPYAGGIHRVGNPTDRRAVSLHLYGPRVGDMDGRDYDPRRDFVCDRLVEPVTQPL
jgi:predicted metal-dependent enzyme (double-stranded beta helix superfamily)